MDTVVRDVSGVSVMGDDGILVVVVIRNGLVVSRGVGNDVAAVVCSGTSSVVLLPNVVFNADDVIDVVFGCGGDVSGAAISVDAIPIERNKNCFEIQISCIEKRHLFIYPIVHENSNMTIVFHFPKILL